MFNSKFDGLVNNSNFGWFYFKKILNRKKFKIKLF
jgi:hypothetical protein